MYPCVRREEVRSIGFWAFPVGRPTEKSVKKWVQRCNFTLRIVARLQFVEGDVSCGWLVKVKTQDNVSCLVAVSAAQAGSHTKLRQHLMKFVNGGVCRMTSDDFLAFVDEDKCLKIMYVSRHIGKVTVAGKTSWHFPSLSTGDVGLYFDESVVRGDGRVPVALPTLPYPRPMDSLDKCNSRMKRLCHAMRSVYGPQRFVRALHICASAMKAIRFDDLMSTYHFVPVTNISGPANCGKTMGCAITLAMMEAPSLMLSRCTPSAMIDAADSFKNMAIVWDDPRDCTHSQMSSIVHEAFNGVPTSLVTRGVRKYNSLIMIGTQERNLGMPQTSMNSATFSRLSHIDMEVPDAEAFNTEVEGELQEALKDMGGMLSFFIATTPFEPESIARIHRKLLEEHPHVIGRSLQIAAIDQYYASFLAEFGNADIKEYFENDYVDFLKMHCDKSDAVQRFCGDLKALLLRRHDFPKACFKERVTVDLKHYGPTECFAVYSKDLLPYMRKHSSQPLSYTKEQLHAVVKSNCKYGETSKNVAFRVDDGTMVRRSLVIRQTFIM